MSSRIVHYPQDEMTNLLLPVTAGCSYNKCIFCSMYKDQIFGPLALGELEMILASADKYSEKVFLTGGDPLALGYKRLRDILVLIGKYLPYCSQVASYASVSNIKKFTDDELKDLHSRGLRLLYIGFETGSDRILRFMKKPHSSGEAVAQALRLNKASLRFNSIIMTGLAGRGNMEESATKTVEMLNSFNSLAIITMNLKVFQGTPLQEMLLNGAFELAGYGEVLDELDYLLRELRPKSETIFDSTHPTNFLKMKGVLPWDRNKLLRKLSHHRARL